MPIRRDCGKRFVTNQDLKDIITTIINTDGGGGGGGGGSSVYYIFLDVCDVACILHTLLDASLSFIWYQPHQQTRL
jgi:hypothetical protein